ncbi:MAG: hypothetical protein H0X02_10430 [Nitrosomonas sp.]|nr:hypothetical protein [Nitrosomonas sp.]
MKTKKTMLTNLFVIVLLAFTLAAPTLAQAGRGHHRGHGHHGHHHHHHHQHSHHQHHLGGYNYVYSQPSGYYNQTYYPQPRYNYYATPAYGYPPSVVMGINTGNASFMLRY